MVKVRTPTRTPRPASRDVITSLPRWVSACAGAGSTESIASGDVQLTRMIGADATIVSAVLNGARVDSADDFHQLARLAYGAVRQALDDSPHRHVVRMWNWIPGIHDPVGDDRDRYVVFNGARFEAMSGWFGGADRFAADLPAASGVGHDGDQLAVHALAVTSPGAAIENPRQVPAYRYSRRYGPLPPCFARATRVDLPRKALLISGTAAITGEDSRYPSDLARQFELTIENLRAVIRAGDDGSKLNSADPIRAMRHVRIYAVHERDMQQIADMARPLFADDAEFELLQADLCRDDLLVEIEGAVW